MKSDLTLLKAKGTFQPPVVTPGGLHVIAPKRRDRGATWSKSETDFLVDLWSADDVQQELAVSAHNSHVYEHLARILNQRGYDRTASQCQAKIKALKRECLLMQQGKLPRSRLRFMYKVLKRMVHLLSQKHVSVSQNSENETPTSPGSTLLPPPSDALHSSESAQSSSAFQKETLEEDSASSLKLGKDLEEGQTAAMISVSGDSDSEFEVSNFVETVELEEDEGMMDEEYRFTESSFSVPAQGTLLVERLLDRFLDFQQESEKRFIEAEERRQQWVCEHTRRVWQDERQHQLKAFETFSKLAQQLLDSASPTVKKEFSSERKEEPPGDG